MHHRFRLGKLARAKRSGPGRLGGAGKAIKTALGAISLAALLLFLKAPGNFAGITLAAASEMEANNLFRRAALKLNATGKLVIIAFGSSSTLGARASSPDRAYPAVLEKYLNSVLGP